MNKEEQATKAPNNRTISISSAEEAELGSRLFHLTRPTTPGALENASIHGDSLEIFHFLPDQFVDLLFLDPPYNLDKTFGAVRFSSRSAAEYESWLESWLPRFGRILKPGSSVYICSDWRSSSAVERVASRFLKIRNRITWEREKGRGAQMNWKSCSEDIWHCTVSDEYTFNLNDVKIKKKVIAPYKTADGLPKDWTITDEGNYRFTYPSNLWTDLTVPFWSMPENTPHPTQKPEKLLARIILASSNSGDFVFDPFVGSGTTSVVAKKLGRRYAGIEKDLQFCLFAEKRLRLASGDQKIQGYSDGLFWERNSAPAPRAAASSPTQERLQCDLGIFDAK